MKRLDARDLREVLGEGLDEMSLNEELWNRIYARSVQKQVQRKPRSWMGLAGLGVAAALILVVVSNLNPQVEVPLPQSDRAEVEMRMMNLEMEGAGTMMIMLADEEPVVYLGETPYWGIGTPIDEVDLGSIVENSLHEIRQIQGVDPREQIAVKTLDGWVVYESRE